MTKRVVLVSILLLLVGLSGCIGESESGSSTQSAIQVVTLEIINDCENAEVHIQSTTLANGRQCKPSLASTFQFIMQFTHPMSQTLHLVMIWI